jgi:hypothetical protein
MLHFKAHKDTEFLINYFILCELTKVFFVIFRSRRFVFIKTFSPAVRYNLVARTPGHKDFHFHRG